MPGKGGLFSFVLCITYHQEKEYSGSKPLSRSINTEIINEVKIGHKLSENIRHLENQLIVIY